ncbi:MAG: hypothetical protein RLZ37_1891, partial [Actinomycetota bacterium]
AISADKGAIFVAQAAPRVGLVAVGFGAATVARFLAVQRHAATLTLLGHGSRVTLVRPTGPES